MIESMALIITTNCNLSCQYCYYTQKNENYKRSKNYMSFDRIERLFKTYSKDKKLNVIALSGGEPFLHPEIYKIIDFISGYAENITVLTNGTLLDEDKILWLKKRNVMLNISIDSLSADYSNNVRGKHDTLLKVLEILNKNNYENVTLFPTLTSSNLDDSFGLMEFSRLKNFNIAIGFVDLDKNNPLSLYNLTNEKKEKLIKVLESKVFDPNQLAFSRQAIEFLIEDPNRKVLMPSCSNSSSSVTVDADGTVYPCFHRKEILATIDQGFDSIEKNHLEWFKSNYGKLDCLRTACLRV